MQRPGRHPMQLYLETANPDAKVQVGWPRGVSLLHLVDWNDILDDQIRLITASLVYVPFDNQNGIWLNEMSNFLKLGRPADTTDGPFQIFQVKHYITGVTTRFSGTFDVGVFEG